MWTIYVSDKPNSRINFPIGLERGIWGVHANKAKTIENVNTGDLVVFVYAISWLKGEGEAPRGFSRVSKENVDLFRGSIQQLVIAEVTASYYKSNEKVWPDDVYPHRFKFKVIKHHKENLVFGTEFFNSKLVEGVRYSACTQGSVTRVDDIKSLDDFKPAYLEDNQDVSMMSKEGRPIWKLHKSRERDSKLSLSKKKNVMAKTGVLECEVCSLDFAKAYGSLGLGFAECHHKNPLSLRSENEDTKEEDLAILCSNCHRMIHRSRPWLSIKELKEIYDQNNNY